jgi:SOS response regulatory protein OraA/RecX
MPVITALRERPRGKVEISLDGAPWRLVPADAVVRTGLAVGRTLDRPTARTLARELRRAEALGVAVRALRHRDLSRRRLEERLASRGAGAAAQADAIATLEQAGLVDDARVGEARAQALAARGYGDAAIRAALEAEGLPGEAVERLEPELERARRVMARRGGGSTTLRRLAARGFDPAILEDLSGFAEDA